MGVAPTFCLHKELNSTGPWFVCNVARTGDTGYMYLDQDITGSTSGQNFYTAKPTSSLINLGTDPDINQSGQTYVAYCFAEVQGFSRFGTYTSNGNADGSFIYTGFKPAWVLLRNSTSGSHSWLLFDNQRDPINAANQLLMPNQNSAESETSNEVDFLSNGFKLRSTGTDGNESGSSIVYIAFAENPFVANDSGTAIPTTAG